MARVVEDNRVVRPAWWNAGQVVAFGAVVGVAYYLVMLLVGRYIVEPLACREIIEASACVAATATAGKISTVIVAVAAIFGMIRLGIARPLVVAAGAAVVLWNLSEWTAGLFWLEAFAWSVLLYALAYALFGWIAHFPRVIVSIVVAVIVAVLLAVLLMLV
ncbi:hypothetical protein CL689_07405 [Candidatus Saccharibacteria bacterium]|nr:hypothetical protein [Candidatus Saccharibacteria bacterium]